MKHTILTLLTFLLGSSTFLAQPGTLDPNFGNDGSAIYLAGTWTGQLRDAVVLDNGKVIVCGEANDGNVTNAIVMRLNDDGSRDENFGQNGIAMNNSTTESQAAYAVHILDNGDILAGGYSGRCIAVFKYNPDGIPLASFGDNGVATHCTSNDRFITTSMQVQEDEKIILGGYILASGNPTSFFVIRFNPDGQLDENFGNNGITTSNITGNGDFAFASALLSDGRIVLAGVGNNFTDKDPLIAMYTADGDLDQTFGKDGSVLLDLGFFGEAQDVTVTDGDKIIVTGRIRVNQNDPNNNDFLLVQFLPDGSLDASFGEDGWIQTDVGQANDKANGVIVQPDGKIIVAGEGVSGSQVAMTTARYWPDGNIDETYGDEGLATTTIEGFSSFANAVAWTDENKIIAVGRIYDGSSDILAAARFFTETIVSATNLSIEYEFNVYPNPTQSELFLEYTLSQNEVLNIDIYDIRGKYIQSYLTKKASAAGTHKEHLLIDLQLPNGNYILKWRSEKGSFAKPFTVHH